VRDPLTYRINRWLLLGALAAVAGISLLLCTAAGPSGIALPGSIGTEGGVSSLVLTQIRLPRVIAALLVGGGLAAAGTGMQGLFKNPLADPYVIGTSAGAALGAAISFVIMGGAFLAGAAFTGACVSTLLVYLIARRSGRVPVETLLLAGVAVSFFFSSLLSFLMYRAGENLHQIMFWLMGGLWNADWGSAGTGLLIIPCVSVLVLFAREIDILSLGDEEASTLGVNAEQIKVALLAVTAGITGIAVSIAGSIGFIGLMTPHIMRHFTGPGHRFLVPAAFLAGGILLVWADMASRTFCNDMPVGIITAFFGAPFFLYLIRRRPAV
jgi:iron complex transport system permease protein